MITSLIIGVCTVGVIIIVAVVISWYVEKDKTYRDYLTPFIESNPVYYSCEKGVHIWGKWESNGSGYQHRRCIHCNFRETIWS